MMLCVTLYHSRIYADFCMGTCMGSRDERDQSLLMKRLIITGLLIVTFVIALASPLSADGERHATVIAIKGDSQVRIEGRDWQTAQVGQVLKVNDEVRTGKKSFVKLDLDDGETGLVTVKAESLFRLATMERKENPDEKVTLLDLAIGQVLVQAEKLKGDSKFEVRTPVSTTGVRGTRFEVTVEAEDIKEAQT